MLRHESESFRVVGLCWLADACVALDHAEPADLAHAELAPYGDAWAVGGTGFYTPGSVRRALGELELLRGRTQNAVDELTRAAESHAQPGATLLRLWTDFDLARALRRRAGPADHRNPRWSGIRAADPAARRQLTRRARRTRSLT